MGRCLAARPAVRFGTAREFPFGEEASIAMASAFLASLLLSAGAAEPGFWAMNTPNFTIPISTDANQRANIKELELWSSNDEGKTWQKVASVAPERDSFGFLAPRDGMYWFSLV